MGYYINPPDKSKEQFLKDHGTRITTGQALAHDFASDSLPICFVNNGAFTAAGIGYDKAEVETFANPDERPKFWFTVPRNLLKPYFGD